MWFDASMEKKGKIGVEKKVDLLSEEGRRWRVEKKNSFTSSLPYTIGHWPCHT